MSGGDLIRAVERLIYAEADLLDGWRLKEWEALLADDARYLVPPIGVANNERLSPADTLFVIAETRAMIGARVERMLANANFAESPRSGVRHLIGNIQVLSADDTEVLASSNFCVYRIRRAAITSYVGRCLHRLVRSGDGFRIREKRVMLDNDVLTGQGGLSLIL